MVERTPHEKLSYAIDKFLGVGDKLLRDNAQSEILSKFIIDKAYSLFYANVISNFFSNLTSENVYDYNLPKGKISAIKKKYRSIRSDVNRALSHPDLSSKKINEEYYTKFSSINRMEDYFLIKINFVPFI